MGRFKPASIFFASTSLTLASAAAWTAAGEMSGQRGPADIVGMILAGAVALTALAGMCWIELRREILSDDGAPRPDEMRHREEVLIRAIDSLVDERDGNSRKLRSV